MEDKGKLNKLKNQLQMEVDAAFLYQKLSEKYLEEPARTIFTKMSAIENKHAAMFLKRVQEHAPNYVLPAPSIKARFQIKVAEWVGYDFVINHLAAVEWKTARSIVESKQAKGQPITGYENVHLNILKNISSDSNLNTQGETLTRLEGKHRSIQGNALRAAVLGANDGLVSNMSLVMGVAGAAQGGGTVLIAGVAGLLAGSISMALGEWLSVQSSREYYQRQIDIEAEELENSPEEEMNELTLLYQAKGINEVEARKMAEKVFANKDTALEVLVKEELGIDKEGLGGSAHQAAIASFLLFSVGALIPLFPFFFRSDDIAIMLSIVLSTIGLFLIGGLITFFTGKSFLYAGMRQIVFGLLAAAITFSIGKAIGISVL